MVLPLFHGLQDGVVYMYCIIFIYILCIYIYIWWDIVTHVWCIYVLCTLKRCHVSKWTHCNSSAGKPPKITWKFRSPWELREFFSDAPEKLYLKSNLMLSCWLKLLGLLVEVVGVVGWSCWGCWLKLLGLLVEVVGVVGWSCWGCWLKLLGLLVEVVGVVGWICWGCWLKLLGLLVEVVGLAKSWMNSICQKSWSTTSHQMMIGACTFVKCFAARWRSSCSTDFMIMKWGPGHVFNLNDPLRQIWNASERQCKNLAKRGTFSRCYSQLVNSYFCCLMFFLFHWREIPIKQA